jgi:transcriptional regulator with XRE-family HTH domain
MGFEASTLRARREALGLSQGQLARKAAVSRSAVSHWETGRGAPDEAQAAALEAVLKAAPAKGRKAAAKKAPRKAVSKAKRPPRRKVPPTVAAWLSEQRASAKLEVAQLAKKAGLSPKTVGHIEEGRAPWPRKRTRRRLERILGELPEATAERAKEEARVEGLGLLTDFAPHDEEDHPKGGGLFVLYDTGSRPVYVGRAGSVRKRLAQLSGEAWFKAPTVEQAAFLAVEDGPLREALESLLVRTLRGALLVRTRHDAE